MSEEAYQAEIEKERGRKRTLEPYHGYVKEKLGLYPETTAAQMHDWLKEHYTDFHPLPPEQCLISCIRSGNVTIFPVPLQYGNTPWCLNWITGYRGRPISGSII